MFEETPAKELTKANGYQRHSYSKPLLIDVIFIWFSDDVYVIYAEKFGEWHLVQHRIKRWCQNAFFAQELRLDSR